MGASGRRGFGSGMRGGSGVDKPTEEEIRYLLANTRIATEVALAMYDIPTASVSGFACEVMQWILGEESSVGKVVADLHVCDEKHNKAERN